MRFPTFDHQLIETDLLTDWEANGLREEANELVAKGKPFYFLDGPPYTSGKVHIGTAWNKSMKDAVLRYRRMQGRKVWDRAGYDMHGLPIEHAAMRELELKTKEDIEGYGVDRFVRFCEEFALRNLETMNEDFVRLGIWMDFSDAYQTISREWTRGVWWLVQKAHADGRLYEGLRPMYWDSTHQSALAKHELFYKEVTDDSIYVKFPIKGAKDEFLVIWTTTPWTIPFNLMIMANPAAEYARVRVGSETWILASERVEAVLEAAGTKGEIVGTLTGAEIGGIAYEHFLADVFDYASLKNDHSAVHTVVLSAEYVTTDSGSGLVHAAPGCGPEDYEIGVREGVPAWNLLDESGRFPAGAGVFSGRRARVDDAFFTDEFAVRGMLVARQPYTHDYPFAERSKEPIVYKATKQWFFRIDDLRDEMVAQNRGVHWTPQAGFNAFNSWLSNLRDNSITKQRFWGTPLPIWRNVADPGDVLVVASPEELEELCGRKLENLHKPWIDDVVIERAGKEYRRIPDVIDVWVDAGVASWSCLHFPERKDLLEEFFPADFIIEGNDQVRGWFNLLMVTSAIAFGKAPFKNVYMHGMIQDAQGRKMSKSEGNYIVPSEVVDRFGADACRLYWIGGTRAGQDLNYNVDDCENKQKSLRIYWNIHKYIMDLAAQAGAPTSVKGLELAWEDRYILSRAHSTAARVAELIDSYHIDRIPEQVEALLDDISRTYIQLVRQRAASDQKTVLSVLWEAYSVAIRLLAPLCPFVTDAIWRNLSGPLGLTAGSVHLAGFPKAAQALIAPETEEEMERAMQVLSQVLSARDQAQIGVRWPLRAVHVSAPFPLSDNLKELVSTQANVHDVEPSERLAVSWSAAPNYRALGKAFGQDTGAIAKEVLSRPDELGAAIARSGKATVLDHELTGEHVDLSAKAPEGFTFAGDRGISVLLDARQDEELVREGYLRELVRRIQQARKDADLDKADRISLVLHTDVEDIVTDTDAVALQVGASEVRFSASIAEPHEAEASVKDRSLRFGFRHLQ